MRKYSQEKELKKEKKYKKIAMLGEGSFGEVAKVKCIKDGQEYARKRIKLDFDRNGIPSTVHKQIQLIIKTLREISALRYLNHPNIIKIIDIEYEPSIEKEVKFDIFFELVDQDLHKYIRRYEKQGKLSQQQIKIVHAMDYCHRKRLFHRDLKPCNILISETAQVKICDFGLIRPIRLPEGTYSRQPGTITYQSPELLIGAVRYSFHVDVWAVGCIFAELVIGRALFYGETSLDQLFKIFEILGTPDEAQWKGITNSDKYKFFPVNFPKFKEQKDNQYMHQIRKTLGEVGYDLFRKMIEVNPSKRICFKKSLQHNYFEGLKEQFNL